MEAISDKKLISEIIDDKELRLRSLYKIINKSGQLINFIPNSVQKIINRSDSNRKMILKARQFGVTTNEVIKMLDYCLWTYNRTACILAHEQDGIKKIFRTVRLAQENLPIPFRVETDKGGGSMYEMRFPDNNSKIYCDLESRGDTIHWLHVSEAAFVKDPSRVKSTMQTVPKDGVITLETTPNGLCNWFYDVWADQEEDYDKIFCPWFLHEEYAIPTSGLTLDDDEINLIAYVKQKYGVLISMEQIAFRRAKKKDLKHLFRQEYPEDDQTCFLSSGNAAIDAEKITEMRSESLTPISEIDGLKIFKKADKFKRYVIGADPAEGYDGDYCVASVFEVGNIEQVACLRGHFKPHDFANRISELGSMYSVSLGKMPTIAVERNNHGHAVLLELYEHLQYPNLYQDKDEKIGWLTDRISRPIMLDTFIEAIETGRIKINDSQTIQECLTLVELDGRIEAGTSKHDDCVIASAIALQLCIKESSALFYEDIGKMIRV